MNIWGFIIGTAIPWGLTYGVAVPLARIIAGTNKSELTPLPLPVEPLNQTGTPGVAIQAAKQPDAVDSVPTGAFVMAHVLVLGVAGFLLGAIAGLYFVGFAMKAKVWPGMIALIVASLLGASMGS